MPRVKPEVEKTSVKERPEDVNVGELEEEEGEGDCARAALRRRRAIRKSVLQCIARVVQAEEVQYNAEMKELRKEIT